MSDLDRYLDQLEPEMDLEVHKRMVRAQTEVKEVFLNLTKHGKTRRLYGNEHHLPKRFLDTLLEILAEFLEEFEMLQVDVEPDELLYQQQPVFKNDEGEQLAYGLYTEGLRGIVIQKGADHDELNRLAEVLGRDWLRREEGDEDLMAAAWRAEFVHVHLDVADRFSEEDEHGESEQREDLALGRSAGADPTKLRGDSVLIPEIQGLIRELEANALDPERTVRMKQDEVALYARIRREMEGADDSGGDEELMRLDSESAALMTQEIAEVGEADDAPVDRIAAVIFEVLRLNPDSARETGAMLAGQVLRLCEANLWTSAAALVRQLLSLLDDDLFTDFTQGPAFRTGYRVMLSERGRDRMAVALRDLRDVEASRGALFTLFAPLPASAASDLVAVGAAQNDPAIRQILADVLVIGCKRDAEVPFKLLQEARDSQQFVPLLALSRLDYPRAVEAILRRAGDFDPEIRELALRSLRRYQSPNIKSAMVRALDDPESGPRVEALRYLAVYRDPELLGQLGDRIQSDLLDRAEEAEIKAWMMSYGIIGRERAVELLLRIALGDARVPGSAAVVRPMAVRGLNAANCAQSRSALRQIGRSQPQLRDLIRSLGVK